MDYDARGGDAPKPPIVDELSVILSRQDLSWQKGDPLPIEQLFNTIQSKSPDGRELLDLICNEIYLRQLNGETPTLEDYQQRFPDYAKAISIQWQVDGFLAGFVASDESTSKAVLENEESVNQNEVTKIEAAGAPLRPTAPLHDVPPELLKHPNYRLKRQIGRGGMGTVWLAEQLSMQRMVAIKLVRSDLAAKPESIARFRRELQAVARLRHPNIVTAHDAGQFGETLFLVFEYIDGLTLSKCVEHEPLPIHNACMAVRDAALGLVHAHAAGLVHRDIKPGNLIREVDGLVKVLDFGLVVEPSDESSITGENIVMGTLDYISPEQANDPREADARSDIYSLGCTLYHLISGRAPFKGLSPLKKLDAQRFINPEPIPNVPQGLQEIVSKMMAKRPEDRFQNASEVVTAITPFCSLQFSNNELHAPQSVDHTQSQVMRSPTMAKLIANDHSPKRLSRRAVVLASAGVCGGLLMLRLSSCSNLNQSETLPTKRKPEETIPGTSVRPKRSIALIEPSGFADGSYADITIEGDRLTLNAMNRDQVWLNYQQVTSTSMETQANFQILETRDPEPIVKFIFQSCDGDFHEFSAQFRIRESSVALVRSTPNAAEEILGKANVNLKLRENTKMRFRIDSEELTVTVDDQPVLRAGCQATRYYACVAALYCSVEMSDSRAQDIT